MKRWFQQLLVRTPRPPPRRRRLTPRVEALEDRCVPSGITKVHDLGTASAGSSTTVTLTLTAGVTAGDSILVEVATIQVNTTGTVTVADGAGNAYARDADVSPANHVGMRVLVFSAHHARPLPGGGTLTIFLADDSGSNQGSTVASAAEFAGLGAAAPVDATSGATGGSTSPSSDPATTSHADDLQLGAIFAQGLRAPVAFTPGAGYTALASATYGRPFFRLDLVPEYRVVSATGSSQADGTFGDSRTWAAALVVYRGLDAPPPSPSDLPPGLSDATAAVSVTAGKPVALAKGRTRLRLTLRNTGGTITGPLSLVLTNLPRKARLRGRSGFTARVSPAGSPYLNVAIGGDGLFSPGETLAVTLDFTGRLPRRFRPAFRIVAGVGPR
jgi:hypothetical protein